MRHLLWISLVCAACSHASKAPPHRRAAAAAPVPAAAHATAAKLETLAPSQNVSSLVAHLRYEAAHRPGARPSADRALDALAGAGVELTSRRQFLGMAMRASYCAGGTARDGLVVAVCEYPTHAAAEAGKTYMDRQFAMQDTTREVRGAAVMTVVHPGALITPARRALATFATL